MNPSSGGVRPLAAGLSDDWLRTIVSIECRKAEKPGSDFLGAGFLLVMNKHAVLVTAAHVVFQDRGRGEQLPGLIYRVPAVAGSGTLTMADSVLQQSGAGGWFREPDSGLALRFFGYSPEIGIRGIPVEGLIASSSLRAGNPALILGFPFALRSPGSWRPVARRAMVARVDDRDLLVDGPAFPGNSGGPVFYVPPMSVAPPLTVGFSESSGVIGVVIEEVSYREAALGPQTGNERVAFEVSTGLVRLAPSDAILSLLRRPDVVKAESALAARSSD